MPRTLLVSFLSSKGVVGYWWFLHSVNHGFGENGQGYAHGAMVITLPRRNNCYLEDYEIVNETSNSSAAFRPID